MARSKNSYACPHCGRSLKGQFLRSTPAPGERKFLPLNGILLCPFCHGTLHPNPHPVMHKIQLVFLPFSICLLLLPVFPEYSHWLAVVLAFCLGGAAIFLAYVYFKFLRHWPQFSATPNPSLPLSLKAKKQAADQ